MDAGRDERPHLLVAGRRASPARIRAASSASLVQPSDAQPLQRAPRESPGSSATSRSSDLRARWWRPGRGTTAGPRCRCGRRRRPTPAPPRAAPPSSGGRARVAAGGVRTGARRSSGGPGSSPSTSHSFSHTRRPIVASSIERDAPLRWLHACMMQITPHLRVPSVSHQRSASRSTGATARGLVGRRQLLAGGDAAGRQRRAEPPGPHAEPPEVLHRVAEVGQLPVEDRPQPVGADEQVPEPEVAVDDPRLVRASGRFASSQRNPSSKAGWGSPSPSSTSRYCATWSDAREPVDGVGRDAVDRRHRRADLRAEPRRAPSPTRRRAAACGRSSRPRAARPPCPALPSTDPSSAATTPATGTPRVGRRPEQRRLGRPCRSRSSSPSVPAASAAGSAAAARRPPPGRTTTSPATPRRQPNQPLDRAPRTRRAASRAAEVASARREPTRERRGRGGRGSAGAPTARGGSAAPSDRSATAEGRHRSSEELAAGERRGASRRRATAGYGLTAAPPSGWISKWRWGVPRALPVSPT